jgi:hypothetical protein
MHHLRRIGNLSPVVQVSVRVQPNGQPDGQPPGSRCRVVAGGRAVPAAEADPHSSADLPAPVTLAEVARSVNSELAGRPIEVVLDALTQRVEAAGLRPSAALVRRYAVSISDQQPADSSGAVAV